MAAATRALIIEVSTRLFQQKGYIGVGLNEILKVCQISKGSLYHHFPGGKEELLIACLQTLNDAITQDAEAIFARNSGTLEALEDMIGKLTADFEAGGTLMGYTFSSMVSEMASLSDPVRHACGLLYARLQDVYARKLEGDGYHAEEAASLALLINAAIEGGMLLSLTQRSAEPLKRAAGTLSALLWRERGSGKPRRNP
ncbi:TetR/AcrR family transcriptional regulator [Paenibacillus glufosinatiresistens]|uniref:TetR/AcrR family transcriptional regulator n=1 Tax=Paenibacillus glufosinatiresistens TaxID=3070657 RepID=UPI00286DF9D6|nr:TetR/AcrR family transcriptional regulator [Paenibacillus sp. YX.27]